MAMVDLFFNRFKDAEQCRSGDDPSSQVPDCPQGISSQGLSNCLETGNHVFMTKRMRRMKKKWVLQTNVGLNKV